MSNNNDIIKLTFKCDGVGPHHDGNNIANCNFDTRIPKIAIYAENGTGKTFFSRMFALQRKRKNGEPIDAEKLISLGHNNGEFQFTMKDDSNSHTYSVKLDKSKEAIINIMGTNYIYHVFNSDYVNENIAATSYSPDDNITGYVLGQDNIDTSEDKNTIKQRETLCESIEAVINKKVEEAKEELKKKKVNSSVKEFKAINTSSLFDDFSLVTNDSYDVIVERLNKLKSIPDNIPDIRIGKPNIDLTILETVKNILTTIYDKSHFDKEAMTIVESVKANSSFYQQGLDLLASSNENICPFCKHNLDEDNMFYLNLYRYYFMQSEAQTIEDIKQKQREVSFIKESIEKIYEKYSQLVIAFQNFKDYVPKYQSSNVQELPNKETIIELIDQVIDALNTKIDDIENNNFDIDIITSQITSFVKTLDTVYNAQLLVSEQLYSVLLDSNKTRLNIVRDLCIARHIKLYDEVKDDVKQVIDLKAEIDDLKKALKQKENRAKTSKKELVVKDLKIFLDYFFHMKYQFDEKTFGISFNSHSLDKKAKDVLSDGEKSIVAFCYYLASTHLLVETESDYQDLFFVFDDPISSMDFKYVYAIADIIRGLPNAFDISRKYRFLILTHNAEFMSLLVRNKISNLNLSMIPGKIGKLKQELLMPYEYHLMDIINVSNGNKTPDHTIPNSIRHVIETIMRFENPKANNIEEYMNDNNTLNKNAYLYALMQDNSHGIVRKQPAISDQEIIEACSVVVNFVTNKFPKQIPNI